MTIEPLVRLPQVNLSQFLLSGSVLLHQLLLACMRILAYNTHRPLACQAFCMVCSSHKAQWIHKLIR